MSITRLFAAFGAALVLCAPAAQAEEAPAWSDALVIDGVVTAYATGGDGGAVGAMTASGVRTRWGTVAADWRLYPPGTKLKIDAFPDDVFTVEDSGGAVKGNIFDIWFPDLPTAEAFGTRHLKVTVLVASERP
ncbi:MAG TPA: 3D domain-containing protein [Chloroflexota bacterium]|nr:3D domain-containing protein [Chloroflexota bacterium]